MTTTVTVNLTVEGLPDELETVGYGALIALNDDDDNHNQIEDRRELKGPIGKGKRCRERGRKGKGDILRMALELLQTLSPKQLSDAVAAVVAIGEFG